MKKNILYMMIMAVSFSVTACKVEQDDFFSDSSSNRADASIEECINVLTEAPYGWKLRYFPSSEQAYGGFNFVWKFDKQGFITCSGDADISDDINAKAKSLYKVYQSSGVTLCLESYNDIFSKLADPKAELGGTSGEGLGGDNEFSVLSVCKDSVVLKGRTSTNHVVLYPMETDDWASYLKGLADVDDEMFAKSYSLLIGEDTTIVYTDLRGLYYQYTEGDDRKQGTSAYVITERGIELYKPLDFKGKHITGFKRDASTRQFVSFEDPDVRLEKHTMNQQFVYSLWYTAREHIGSWAEEQWLHWDKIAKEECFWKKEEYGWDEDLDLRGEIVIVGFGKLGDDFGLFYQVYQEKLFDSFYGLLYLNYTLTGDDEVKFTATGHGSGYADFLLDAGYTRAIRPFLNQSFKVSSDNSRKYMDLKCLNRANNDFRFMSNAIAYPLRKESDRPIDEY